MISSHTFRDEVELQLEVDILNFGWLRQIAERDYGHKVGAESNRAVFDLVQALVGLGIALVGSARNDGERVLIHPWHERGEALREKLGREVNGASPKDRDWVFCLQLAKHYNRK